MLGLSWSLFPLLKYNVISAYPESQKESFPVLCPVFIWFRQKGNSRSYYSISARNRNTDYIF